MTRWLALVLLGLALTVSQHARAQARSAEELYQLAQEHYLARRYTEALPLFERLTIEQKSPNARLYVARCLREMGRLPEAYEQMQRTAREADALARTEPRYVATRDAARRELDALEQRVARITLHLAGRPRDLELEVNGRRISPERAGEAIAVMPGVVRIRASARGFDPQASDLTVEPGTQTGVAIALTPMPWMTEQAAREAAEKEAERANAARSRPRRAPAAPRPEPDDPEPAPEKPPARSDGRGTLVGAIVTGGAGLVGWVMLAVAGTMANHRYEQLQADCGGPCPAARNEEIDEGEVMDTVANVGLGLGLAGTVACGILLGVHFATRSEGKEKPTTKGLDVGLRPVPGGAALSVGGSF